MLIENISPKKFHSRQFLLEKLNVLKIGLEIFGENIYVSATYYIDYLGSPRLPQPKTCMWLEDN